MNLLKRYKDESEVFEMFVAAHDAPFESMPEEIIVRQIAIDDNDSIIYEAAFDNMREATAAFLYRIVQYEACFYDDNEGEVPVRTIINDIGALEA